MNYLLKNDYMVFDKKTLVQHANIGGLTYITF